MSDILLLAALREETAKLPPIDGVAVVVTGDGAARAARGAARAIERERPRIVIGIGVAGAISADLERGTVVAAQAILADDNRLACDPKLVDAAVALGAKAVVLVSASAVASTATKRAFAQSIDGAAAIDLESAAWQRAAASRGLPFLAIRCILDRAGEDLPMAVLRSIRDDGSVSRMQVVARALLQPRSIPDLLALRRRTAEAATALARFLPPLVAAVRNTA